MSKEKRAEASKVNHETIQAAIIARDKAINAAYTICDEMIEAADKAYDEEIKRIEDEEESE